jgi:DNA-binding NarL/FixJ family response regulator
VQTVLADAGIPPAASNHSADYLVTDDPTASGPNVIYVVGDEPLDCRAAVDALLRRRVAAVVSRSDPQQAREIVRALAEGLVVLPIRVLDAADRAPELTPRQQQILPLIWAGLSNAQIAARVHVSLATVKRDVSALLSATGSRTRLDLAVMADRHQGTGLTT